MSKKTPKPFGLAVKAIVTDDEGRVLLLRRSLESKNYQHKWDLPGGKVDPGETFDVALAREVREETRVSVSIEGIAGAVEYPMPAVRVAILFVEARRVGGDVKLSHEHDAFQWTPRAELDSVDLSPQLQVFLQDYVSRLPGGSVPSGAVAVPPHVEVAVALLRHHDRFLAVHNARWETFTLPMTKRRRWADAADQKQEHEEDWADAAGRAAAECLGRTVCIDSEPLHAITDLEYSGRTGEWKHYRVHIFQLRLPEPPQLAAGLQFEWLTAEELLDERRRPISPTAREIIRQLRASKKI